MLKVESDAGQRVDAVVMVQGDEPMVTPEMIEQAVTPMLEDSSIQVVNLMARMRTPEEFEDPNEVKVVVDLRGRALYFSREPIPSRRKGVQDVPMLKQVCIIPFRRNYLLEFNNLPETPLERIESVDMMRVIEQGEHVHMVMTGVETLSVDTPGDLERVVALMNGDQLMNAYQEANG
jgi:3-deoxy-manno-octulosonate cytidylyltransferase (CMP-KDO synthetase)